MSLDWESLDGETFTQGRKNPVITDRAKVRGGWFVLVRHYGIPDVVATSGAFFYPDPEHKWDGNSLH